MENTNEFFKVVVSGKGVEANRYTQWDAFLGCGAKDHLKLHREIYLVDVDGTLRNGAHRVDLLPTTEQIITCGDRPNVAFSAFNEQCHLDTEIPHIVRMVNTLSAGVAPIILLTSCTYTEHSLEALISQMTLWGVNWDILFIRDSENHMYPVEMKRYFVEATGMDTHGGVVALDDCPKNCEMFREMGITALQVEDWSRFKK